MKHHYSCSFFARRVREADTSFNPVSLWPCAVGRTVSVIVPIMACPRVLKLGGTVSVHKRRHAGSLAGAAHLSQQSAGVQNHAHVGAEIPGRAQGKTPWQIEPCTCEAQSVKAWPSDPLSANPNACRIEARGDRKITTGITGLWLPRVPIDVAF